MDTAASPWCSQETLQLCDDASSSSGSTGVIFLLHVIVQLCGWVLAEDGGGGNCVLILAGSLLSELCLPNWRLRKAEVQFKPLCYTAIKSFLGQEAWREAARAAPLPA